MTSPRRLIAAVSLAAGAAALLAPTAHATDRADATGAPSVLSAIDKLGTTAIPEEHRAQLPTVESQLSGLQRLNDLHQLTDLVAPVTNAVPAVQ
ncbi:hypothetical protein [Streptomyces kanamyceticus]|uniref:Secreted protein n=1 Tax=Streptomyces kanamyceticus TaxID=1967 RepID=A0A5J6GK12_STRKN|nr:hypothetical protein [Streptomyces kanamyceticus]QEU94295.1 hypothetical protein CP970_28360 [Streptomyces kanamyceticus]